MKAVFISDVHLHKAQEERHRKLIEFLDDIREGKIQSLIQPDRPSTDKIFIDDLYIVGDLFDFWFCQENEIYPDFVPVITKLLELKKTGVGIHLCEGNHDFFLTEYFHDVLGMNVFEEETRIKLNRSEVFIAHGDQADATNKRYLLLRKFLRSGFFYKFQRRIPVSLRWFLAGLSSTVSKKMTRDQGEDLVKKMSPFVLKKFQDGCDVVILGHSHLPQKTVYNINGQSKEFITLGDWIYHYSFLYYNDEEFCLGFYRTSLK